MAANTFVTQEALIAYTESAYSTRVTQAAITIGAIIRYSTRVTQAAVSASTWTAFHTRSTQAAIVPWVITCDSKSYVKPPETGLIVLTATPGPPDSGEIDLAWNGFYGWTYDVYRGTAPGEEAGTPIAMGLTVTSFIDTGRSFHQAYYYMVVGTNPCTDTSSSNEASAVPGCILPDAPMGLEAEPGVSIGQIIITWDALAGCTYDVYRQTAMGENPGTQIATGLTDARFVDYGAPHDGRVFYTVSAINACGLGDASAQALIVIDCCTKWTPSTIPCQAWISPTSPCEGWGVTVVPRTQWTPPGC